MTGVFDGIEILDLSWGISGPVATMLLADNGARVTKIEPPGGDPFRTLSGHRVWSRGKRSAVLDLQDDDDHAVFRELAAGADVVVESFAPGVAERLGIDHATLRRDNPRLVHCSITGYGLDGPHADRPAYDALVAARTGQQWEHRGVTGGTIERVSGGPGMMAGVEPPTQECWAGPPRKGPLFSGVPWPSMATAYLATLGISTALRVREQTGRGQHVHTSLLQGVLLNTVFPWQRAERFDADSYQSWIIDPRAPKGFYKSSDDVWIHQWVPLPGFLIGAAAQAEGSDGWEVTSPREAPLRISLDPADMVILHEFDADMRTAMAQMTAQEWLDLSAKLGVPLQAVRSPEDALLDAGFLEDGCVIEVEDPDLGPLRQVGRVYRLSACPVSPPAPPAAVGEHTEEVRREAREPREPVVAVPSADGTAAPLAGIRVLDLGLAVAGPFGNQLLADLGADVIKVHNLTFDPWWAPNHMAMSCNRGKRSIILDLKDPAGLELFYELVRTADVVQHNMRTDAVARLKVDYETLRTLKPDLIYGQGRGFEESWRAGLSGNDQTGAALAGCTWLDGAVDSGGRPLWSPCSTGDTGSGLLSAIALVQALFHRDRTGEGQFVDTSILYAHLLNASMSWISPDGETAAERPKMDLMHLGWSALYRLVQTADDWLCIAVVDAQQWEALCAATGLSELADDPRFATPDARRVNDAALWSALDAAFVTRGASDWFTALDSCGVPCEISTPDFVLGLFDDPTMIERNWVTSYEHRHVGKMDVAGLLVDFDETPGVVQGPAPWPGTHTVEILTELGYEDGQIKDLVARKVVATEI